MNELRQGVATKDQLEALEKVVGEMKDRLNTSDGSRTGSSLTVGKIYAAIGAAVAILGIVITIANAVFSG